MSRSGSPIAEICRRRDWPEAVGLLFHHYEREERGNRTANALRLLKSGELNPAGLHVVKEGPVLLGAMLSASLAGAGGLVWPPQVRDITQRPETEDCLVRFARAWLRDRGAKLAQALLLPEERPMAEPLERNGFQRVTGLCYLRHYLDLPLSLLTAHERISYRTYPQCPEIFQETLLRTYEGSCDCPEVNGVRTIVEIIDGHRAQGKHDPGHWWLALVKDRPVGVLLAAEVPDWHSWEVSYVGVTPEARRHGFGRELTRKALLEARAADVSQLTLSLDDRNEPARRMYLSLDFEPYEQRDVFLAFLQ